MVEPDVDVRQLIAGNLSDRLDERKSCFRAIVEWRSVVRHWKRCQYRIESTGCAHWTKVSSVELQTRRSIGVVWLSIDEIDQPILSWPRRPCFSRISTSVRIVLKSISCFWWIDEHICNLIKSTRTNGWLDESLAKSIDRITNEIERLFFSFSRWETIRAIDDPCRPWMNKHHMPVR